MAKTVSESIWLSSGTQKLHLKRFYVHEGGMPVFLVHGSVENSHIFYSASGKGLAPWLASRGFDVFVADLRGRGKSEPPVDKNSLWGLHEMMGEDFPLMLDEIVRLSGQQPQHWMAHSWGGVMQLAYLARWQAPAPVASLTFFGTKRRIVNCSLKKLLIIDSGWAGLGELLTQAYGYLPAKNWHFGAENESARTYRETRSWVKGAPWLDPLDGFDYADALKRQALPPALYITGAGDRVLGNAIDVRYLMNETGADQVSKLLVAGKSNGFLHNYDHINLLTHADAPADVFPAVEEWIKRQSLKKISRKG